MVGRGRGRRRVRGRGRGRGGGAGEGQGGGRERAHRRPWTLVPHTGPPRTSLAAPGGRTGRAARGGDPARAHPPPARRASRAWGRDGTTPGGLSAKVHEPGGRVADNNDRPAGTTHGDAVWKVLPGKKGCTRAGAHRRVGRRRRMDRSHEDDVRVLVDEVLRGVSTRAHRPGAVVGAHGDAPSSRHVGDRCFVSKARERCGKVRYFRFSHRLSLGPVRANSLRGFVGSSKDPGRQAGTSRQQPGSRAKEHRALGRPRHCRARAGFRPARTRSRVPSSILFARR